MLTRFSPSPRFGGWPAGKQPGVMNRAAREAYAKRTQEAAKAVNGALPTVRKRMKNAGCDMGGVGISVRPNGQGVNILVPADWTHQQTQQFSTTFDTVVRGLPKKFDAAKPLLLNEVLPSCIL